MWTFELAWSWTKTESDFKSLSLVSGAFVFNNSYKVPGIFHLVIFHLWLHTCNEKSWVIEGDTGLGSLCDLHSFPLVFKRPYSYMCVQSWRTTQNSIPSGIPFSWGNRHRGTQTGMLPGLLSWNRKAKCPHVHSGKKTGSGMHWLEFESWPQADCLTAASQLSHLRDHAMEDYQEHDTETGTNQSMFVQ